MSEAYALETEVDTPRIVEAPRGKGVHLYTRISTDPSALQRLIHISGLRSVAAPVVALPDLHWKERLETPSSTAIATHTDIVPSFSSPSQNCGMTVLTTPFSQDDLSAGFLDGLMSSLRSTIPRRRRNASLEHREVLRYCGRGAPAAAERFGVDPAVCERIEFGGNALSMQRPDKDEVERVMDRNCVDAGRYSFAFVGGGNHFLELQVVTDVIDPVACSLMGLEKGMVLLMLHTGSERLGHDLGRLYSRRRKTTAKRRRKLFWRKVPLHLMRDVSGPGDLRRRWKYYFRRSNDVAVPADSSDGRRLELSLKIAANFGYANRVAVTGLIQNAFRRETGRRDLTLGLVADLSHNMIEREKVDGKDFWVHRHNAVRAPGPQALEDDHPYRSIGQPAMIPGTNRTSSFMVVGRDNTGASLYSVDHGAGRTVTRFARAGNLNSRPENVTRKYTYRAVNPEILEHLSDDAVDEVITTVTRGGLAAPAARMRPVAVLKA